MLKDVLRIARTRLRMKQEEVAEKVKVSKQTYLKWENGSTEPKASQVYLLSKILDVTPNEICKGKLNARYTFDEFIRKKAMTNSQLEVELLMLWQLIPDHEEYIQALEDNYISGPNHDKVISSSLVVRDSISKIDEADKAEDNYSPIRNPLTSEGAWNRLGQDREYLEKLFKDDIGVLKELRSKHEQRAPQKTYRLMDMSALEVKEHIKKHDPEQYHVLFVEDKLCFEDFEDMINSTKKSLQRWFDKHNHELEDMNARIDQLENNKK